MLVTDIINLIIQQCKVKQAITSNAVAIPEVIMRSLLMRHGLNNFNRINIMKKILFFFPLLKYGVFIFEL